MINYPEMNEPVSSRELTDVWQGYNHNLRIADGSMYDMENLSSDRYPVLSPRKPRGVYASPESCGGIIAKDNLCYVDGSRFIIDGYPVEMHLKDGEKQLVSMGAYVIILPDKKWINTKDFTYGDIEATFQTDDDLPVTFTMCRVDGEAFGDDIASEAAPENPANGQYWIDTSGSPHILKQWSDSNSMWTQISTTYIKIGYPNIGLAFSEFDGVTITGLEDQEAEDIKAISGSFVLWGVAEDYIIIVGMLDETRMLNVNLTVSRTMPAMDYVIESNNRLWGCRYGLNAAGETVNEIYASRQADFKNWNTFLGVSTDSYIASVGTDGAFTGAASYLGYPTFFKENCLHKVYGSFPSNFQIQTTACRGVQRGSEKSLAICNEVLYYKSRTTVCRYDGSLPEEIGYTLGDTHYQDAVGGCHGNKYYLSMADDDGKYHLFVYDTALQMWHREDNTKAVGFASARQEMYYIDGDTGKIMTTQGSGEPAEDMVPWFFETGIMGVDDPEQKSISKLLVRMGMEIGAEVDILAEYDSSGAWEPLCSLIGGSLKTYAIPVRPRPCDHLRLRMEGKGDVRLFSISRTVTRKSINGQSLSGGVTIGV